MQQLQPQLEQKAASYREAWGISDLTVQARLEVFRLEPMTRDSSGDAHYLVEYYMVSDALEEMIYGNTLTQAQINEIENFSVKCRDFVLNGYEVTLTDVSQAPTLALAGGEVKYTFSHGVVLQGDTVVYIAPDAQLSLPLKVGDSLQKALDNVVPLKPYLGMAVPIGYADYTVPISLYDVRTRNVWLGLVLVPICLVPYVVPLFMGL